MTRGRACLFALGILLLVVLFTACGLTSTSMKTAELVLKNGKIVTCSDTNPEVQALAAVDGRIIALGTNQQVEPYIGGSTRVIDLQGKLAIPGFIEGHGHLLGLGELKLSLNLSGAANWPEVVAMV